MFFNGSLIREWVKNSGKAIWLVLIGIVHSQISRGDQPVPKMLVES